MLRVEPTFRIEPEFDGPVRVDCAAIADAGGAR
jgi:hypothetical protein